MLYNSSGKKIGNDFIQVTSPGHSFSANTLTKIQFNSAEIKVGTGLTLSSNNVVIGSNISYVRVCATVTMQSQENAASQARIELKKNGTTVKTAYGYARDGYYTSATICVSAIISVSSGNTISVEGLMNDSSCGVLAGSYTFMNVEALK